MRQHPSPLLEEKIAPRLRVLHHEATANPGRPNRYLVDAFTVHAASAMAANTILRSLVGAFLPLAGPKMYATLGLGWGNTLLAFIALLISPVAYIFYKYGERIRNKYQIDFS